MTAAAFAPPDARRPLALALGYAGLIPFVGLAIAALAGPWAGSAAVVQAQLAYGATILAFLGGVHWGSALLQTEPRAPAQDPGRTPGEGSARAPAADLRPVRAALLWGVTPSLIAWAALLLPSRVPSAVALLLLAAGLVVARLVDARLYPAAAAPDWFTALRTRLTVVAATSLSVTAIATLASVSHA